MLKIKSFQFQFPVHGGGERALECNLMGKCPFFKNPHNPFRKKICIPIPCLELLDFLKNTKTIGKQ